ncbi:type II secretion system protein N [Halorhodospira halochloris]|uniref:type II secretion system protein N n=1 Tax=Halorhodospira halochloris TaxID=1052 RepID=UPI001EE7C80E|nr:type II secretion system protein N [Halorhodospira halochloris]MCG5547248.1 hypothetical protein [Halorhodospira halochloris]
MNKAFKLTLASANKSRRQLVQLASRGPNKQSQATASVPKILAYTPGFLNLCLVVLLAGTAAEATWQVVTGPIGIANDQQGQPASDTIPRSEAKGQSGQGSPPNALAEIADYHLFGVPATDSPSGSGEEIPNEAPETTLDLKLKGVMAGGDRNGLGMAIIEQNDGQSAYQTGEEIADGAVLVRVERDRVIFSRDDGYEMLRLEQAQLEDQPSVAAASLDQPPPRMGAESAPPRDSGEAAEREAQVDSSSADNGAESSSDVYTYDVQRLQHRFEQDPRSLLEIFSVTPVMDGSSVRGVRISPRADEAEDLIAATELEEGDVITRIENVPVSDQRRMRALLDQADGLGSIDFAIERDGEEKQVNVNLH